VHGHVTQSAERIIMKTITLELPADAMSLDWCSEEDFPHQLRLAAAIFWYDRGLISQGKGAEIAGLTRAGFLQALSDAKVDALQVTPDELRAELERTFDARR
jgi:predicted HTH domain antitoxin